METNMPLSPSAKRILSPVGSNERGADVISNCVEQYVVEETEKEINFKKGICSILLHSGDCHLVIRGQSWLEIYPKSLVSVEIGCISFQIRLMIRRSH